MAMRKSALTIAVGTAFTASLAAAPAVKAGDNPFQLESLTKGYQVADNKAKEGKCGGDKAKDGKCGGDKADKAKEGSCGGNK